MNIYHQVLHKLYEVTGGKENKPVDFADLVTKLGLYSYYPDIFKHLNDAGWIAESQKRDFVSITHWGVIEARKVANGASNGEAQKQLVREANRAAAMAQELSELLTEFAQNKAEDFSKASAKFAELQKTITQINENLP